MCQIRVNLRRWACLLAALACLLALLPLPAHAAGAASKVVRVGWYEDAYNITGKNGERSGYAYEYEQSVAAYTGWTYEYVFLFLYVISNAPPLSQFTFEVNL